MNKVRLLLVEFTRAAAKRIICLIFFDFNSKHINLQLDFHTPAGNTKSLYDSATKLKWKEDGVGGLRWIRSNHMFSNTNIYLDVEK